MITLILSQLNILCTNSVKLYYTKNCDSPIIHRSHVTATLRVLKRTGFHLSGEIHMIYPNVQYFIGSEKYVSNSTAVRYSL